jgi:16S rRNA (cytosine967-C5)-methyltransferase
MKFDNQLRYAVQIIDTYQGEIPLHAWLKDFFRVHPQMGSRDRRIVSAMVYGHYRLGHAIKTHSPEKRVIAGLFLCQDQPLELLNYFNPGLNDQMALPLTEKIALYQATPDGAEFRAEDIFPWKNQLSSGIDHLAFCLSFLRQPDLFLRIRPGHETTVREKLSQAGIKSTDAPDSPTPASPAHDAAFIPPATLRLPNGFKVEDYFTPDREIVIQDYNSQRVAEFLQPGSRASAPGPETTPSREIAPGPTHNPGQTNSPATTSTLGPDTTPGPDGMHNTPEFFWDACAGSGGKSILAHDLYPKMELFVSDIRDSILRNLRSRFKTADIKKYHAFLVDLATQTPPASAAGADLVLVDAPCTGSGTWGRTPEDSWFFDPEKIRRYSEVQKSILGNIAPHLSPDASLVYCTCSVFKKENEEMAAFIRDTLGLKEQARENLKGYDMRADTLFAARFTR